MKKNLAVIFGSRSCEHDVSIISGLQAVKAADKGKYDVIPVYIARDGAWYVGDKLTEIDFYRSFDAEKVQRVLPMGEAGKLLLIKYPDGKKAFFAPNRTVLAEADVVMPVVHGMNGEDGTLQGMLELMGVPFTSSGVLGSSVGMDKITMRQLFAGCGFPVLPGEGLTRVEWAEEREGILDRLEASLGYPVYVKPANLGSSIGISRADDRAGLANALDVAGAYDRRLLVEHGVAKLKEVNCSVLGYDRNVRASVLEMPVSWDEFLTFDEKYMRSAEGGKQSQGMQSLSRQIPAPIGDELTQQIREMSVKLFKLLDCKGVVRIDYIIDEEKGEFYIGEINTIPGSLAFYLWEATGVSFAELIDEMVNCALYAAAEKNASVFSYDSEILKRQQRGKLTGERSE